MEPLFTRRRLLAAAATAAGIEYFRRREKRAAPRFNEAFRSGVVWPVQGDRPYRMDAIEAGVLDLPSGELFALEPWGLGDRVYQPLPGRFPPGRHRVSLAVATVEPGHQRIAAARLKFGAEAAVKWREAGGYPVDGGTGCFCDAGLVRHLRGLPHPELVAFSDRLLLKLNQSTEPAFAGVREEQAGLNVIAFSTGFGDGWYRNWLGSTPDDRVVEVVTDFEVLPGLAGEG